MLGGLAPVACDSGETNGARHIRGGRWRPRNALYMPAQSAARHDPDLRAFYDLSMITETGARICVE